MATVKTAIQQASFTWATPASSPSAALWASFGSQLDLQLSNTAAGWTFPIDASSPANRIAVSNPDPVTSGCNRGHVYAQTVCVSD